MGVNCPRCRSTWDSSTHALCVVLSDLIKRVDALEAAKPAGVVLSHEWLSAAAKYLGSMKIMFTGDEAVRLATEMQRIDAEARAEERERVLSELESYGYHLRGVLRERKP